MQASSYILALSAAIGVPPTMPLFAAVGLPLAVVGLRRRWCSHYEAVVGLSPSISMTKPNLI